MTSKQFPDLYSLKAMQADELILLCEKIRTYLIETILSNGGHFAANLGVVELTVALHYVFNSPSDRIIWDVGHQSYPHKILTGRAEEIKNIRNFEGISGFPKLEENIHDAFGTGHSSTAISAALGIAAGFKLNHINHCAIAVVGDGALTGGMSFEALNNLATSNANVLTIINDNHIGIDPSTGAIDRHLQTIENIHPNLFENLDIPYHGPIDGHDLPALIHSLTELKAQTGPRILHIRTVKGKGYAPAENEQTRFHSTSKYVKISDEIPRRPKWQDVFGKAMFAMAEKYPNFTGITPAMPSGSGMVKAMDAFPNQFFDVGIAEQHAVTFSSGLALAGTRPFLNIYSTFLQRGYDQLIHDVALQNIPVVFCVDRAGLVGEDGPTHHGAFDISYLLPIPNMTIAAPATASELAALLEMGYHAQGPLAIRYPKGEIPDFELELPQIPGQSFCISEGAKIAVFSTGQGTVLSKNTSLHGAAHFHFPIIKPLDMEHLLHIASQYSHIITVEDGSILGGFGQYLSAIIKPNLPHIRTTHLGIPDQFITHGENDILYAQCGYDAKAIEQTILKLQSQL